LAQQLASLLRRSAVLHVLNLGRHSHHQPPGQLEMRQATLHVLGDDVDVLEMPLHDVAFECGGGAGGVVQAIHDFGGKPNAVRRGEP
jgi:hypothetical protein